MNYNFEEDIINYQFETAQEAQYPDPLDYLNNDFSTAQRQRTSLDSIVRSEEIPSAFTDMTCP